MKRVLILAGNHAEFSNIVKNRVQFSEEPPVTFWYGNSKQSMCGQSFDAIEIVGSFWERRDAGDLYRFANSLLANVETGMAGPFSIDLSSGKKA